MAAGGGEQVRCERSVGPQGFDFVGDGAQPLHARSDLEAEHFTYASPGQVCESIVEIQPCVPDVFSGSAQALILHAIIPDRDYFPITC